jgi:ABC-type transport system involved in multi-copper enzyme maturation permease subunit
MEGSLQRSAGRVFAIAQNTVREAIRNRVLYTLLFFALVLIGTGVLLSTLSYVERERILQDVGMAAIRIFSLMIAIFVGIGLLHKEVDRRTVFTILSKPIGRGEFLVGKYLGLVATLSLQIVVMALCFALVSLLAGAPLGAGHAAAFAMIVVQVAVVVAVATLFSAFTTPMLAAFFTAGLALIGHLSRDLRNLGAQSDLASVRNVTEVLYRALPDLEAFDLSLHATHALPIAASDLLLPLAYGLGYVILTLLAATWIFERRDFR